MGFLGAAVYNEAMNRCILLVAIFLGACTRGNSGQSGTEDPPGEGDHTEGTPEPTPLICTHPEALGAVDFEVPIALSGDGALLHWCSTQNPIAVTYEAGLTDKVGDIQAALDVWAAPECSDMEFVAPAANEVAPASDDASDLRIHFYLIDAGEPDAASTQRHFFSETGEIFSVGVGIKESSATPHYVETALGRALGLNSADDGVESLMAGDYTGDAVTAGDEISLCYLY